MSLFLDRYIGQSVTVAIPSGAELRVEVVGIADTGQIRLAFDGGNEFQIKKTKKFYDGMKKSVN